MYLPPAHTNKHLIQISNLFARLNMAMRNERRCFEVCGRGSNPNFPKARCQSTVTLSLKAVTPRAAARQQGLQISVLFFCNEKLGANTIEPDGYLSLLATLGLCSANPFRSKLHES
jgi:hypothetical protein